LVGKTESGTFVHPNLVENLEFASPNAQPGDIFKTTTLGYTKVIKTSRIDYRKKLDDELKHRLNMRKLVLNQHFDYGTDPNNNCPSNEQKWNEGTPLFKEVTSYSKADLEENKNKIEKQNFTISHGIPGGKDAEKDVWVN
jgi:hypothetical protein